jgi:hypothetical protein
MYIYKNIGHEKERIFVIVVSLFIQFKSSFTTRISVYFGAGNVSKKVENNSLLSSGGQYILPNLRSFVPKVFAYFDADLTYYFNNDYALNFGVNTFEVFYSDQFELGGSNKNKLGGSVNGFGTQNTISYALTTSKKIYLTEKFSVSPEIGLGLINYKNSSSSGSSKTIIDRPNFNYTFSQKNSTEHIKNGVYVPFNLKFQYSILKCLSANLKAGYQLNFKDYHTKNKIEYTATDAPNEIGKAQYKYNNFLFMSLGASLQIFDENGQFLLH